MPRSARVQRSGPPGHVGRAPANGERGRVMPATIVDLNNGIAYSARQKAFIFTNERNPLMYGGVSSGKTYALCRRALRYATKFPGNRGLLARFHLGESRDTLLETWKKVVPDHLYRMRRDEWGWVITILADHGGPPSQIFVRSLRDVDRFGSMELGFFGISQANDQGITRRLWDMLDSRLRWKLPPGYGHKVQEIGGGIAWVPDYTGFAEANSGTRWIIDLWGPKRIHATSGYLAVEVSIYDNPFNTPEYVQAMEAKAEWWKKWFLFPCWEELAELAGTPVFQGHFDMNLHVSRDRVEPESGWPIVRGWDVPGPVGTVWFQIDRENRCRVLYEQLANMGESLQDVKLSVLTVSRTLFPDFSFLDISDPTGITTKSPTDEKTCADILRPEINLMVGEVTLAGRLEAGRNWLDRLVHTKPAVEIDPGCRILYGGLMLGYCWKHVAGRDLPEPQKNSYSHIVDAFLTALARVSSVTPRKMLTTIGPRDFGPPA